MLVFDGTLDSPRSFQNLPRGTMHLAPLIRDLAIILGVAGLISLLFQRIRQPVVLGYIIAGIAIGPYTPPFQLITDLPSIKTWAELGVIFLMFTLGLEFSFRKLARVGGSATIAASAETLFFLPTGYFFGKMLGWSSMDSVFLGAMLSISSTTIIIKALDELKLKKHRFAELIFAILIVEDLFAILLLVGLGTIALTKTVSLPILLTSAGKLILVVGGWFIAGYLVVPRFMRYVGRIGSDEVLTILSLGLCLALVVFANYFSYSTALGAFIMGSIIAESPVLPRIEKSMASLRDVFGAIFFVSIGMLIDPYVLWEHLGAIMLISALTIVGKILSTGLGALISGQTLRNSIQVGFGLAQIGEFSFILAQLGMTLKVTSAFIYPIVVAVSLVTTFTTPYLIQISGRAATTIEGWLPIGIKDFLNRYATLAEARRASTTDRTAFLRPLFRWSMNGLITSVIFVLCSEWLLPIIQTRFTIDKLIVNFLGWATAVVLSLPFIWAMLTAFRINRKEGPGMKGNPYPFLRVFSKLLTLLWISVLSSAFLPAKYIVFITVAVLFFSFLLFYRRLESSYDWFEKHFLSAFDTPKNAGPAEAAFGHLAPWDAHLVRIEIHPNSKFVLKSIADADLRVRHGVNIIAIQRGRQSIITPMPHEVFLPKDQLILLGTDEQVDQIRLELEMSLKLIEPEGTPLNYQLRQAKLSEKSPFVGQTIRQSGIREHYHAMVVGIEREGQRKINPDSDFKLQQGDVLWIAGEMVKLKKLIPYLSFPS